MKKKDIEIRLKEEIQAATPDVFSNVVSAHDSGGDGTLTFSPAKRKPAGRRVIRSTLAAACAALVVGVSALVYAMNIAGDSSISIDVNPSIQIVTNRRDRVISVNALNADGEKVIGSMELEKTTLEVAVNALVGSMVKNGYISELKSEILVTVENRSNQKAQQIRDLVDKDIALALEALQIKPTIISQTATESGKLSEIEQQAQANGISYGKALMISRLREKYPALRDEPLESMSTSEIAGLLKQLGIKDYGDIISIEDTREPYCDDCGKLKTECSTNGCADDGDYCEVCGAKEGSCSHFDADDDDDDDDDDNEVNGVASLKTSEAAGRNDDDDDKDGPYCDDCGKLKTECSANGCADDGDYCEVCGAKEGSCRHSS